MTDQLLAAFDCRAGELHRVLSTEPLVVQTAQGRIRRVDPDEPHVLVPARKADSFDFASWRAGAQLARAEDRERADRLALKATLRAQLLAALVVPETVPPSKPAETAARRAVFLALAGEGLCREIKGSRGQTCWVLDREHRDFEPAAGDLLVVGSLEVPNGRWPLIGTTEVGPVVLLRLPGLDPSRHAARWVTHPDDTRSGVHPPGVHAGYPPCVSNDQDKQDLRFDVAITFAGEDRTFANQLRTALVEAGLRVFYDEDFKVEIWGKNLVDFLHRVYSREASFALMLVSRAYVEKHWPNLERRAAQERALVTAREYILPVRLEDVEVPGLPNTTSYLDARSEGVRGVAEAVVQKVGELDPGKPHRQIEYEGDVPETPEQFSTLLALRPPGWEYLLFAGRLREELDARRSEYFDFQMKYTPTPGPSFDWEGALGFLSDAASRFRHYASQIEPMLSEQTNTAAFGAPGEPGDPGRISHLARRIAAVYSGLMSESAAVRAARFPSEHLTEAARLLADWAIQPVESIRTTADELCQRLKDWWRSRGDEGDDVTIIEQVIVFDIPDELVDAFNVALGKAVVEHETDHGGRSWFF